MRFVVAVWGFVQLFGQNERVSIIMNARLQSLLLLSPAIRQQQQRNFGTLLRRSTVLTTSPMRAGGAMRTQIGMDQCANADGPLHDLPDWSFADGTPAPENPKLQKKLQRRKRFLKKILKTALHADKAAEATMEQKEQGVPAQHRVLPEKPSIKKHRKRDPSFYFNFGEEDALQKLEKEGKIPL